MRNRWNRGLDGGIISRLLLESHNHTLKAFVLSHDSGRTHLDIRTRNNRSNLELGRMFLNPLNFVQILDRGLLNPHIRGGFSRERGDLLVLSKDSNEQTGLVEYRRH